MMFDISGGRHEQKTTKHRIIVLNLHGGARLASKSGIWIKL